MQSEYVWLVDPLDGTKSFVRDTPFFSTQIALLRRGELVLGVSSACASGELAWAEKGRRRLAQWPSASMSATSRSLVRRHSFHRQPEDAGVLHRSGRTSAGWCAA